MKSRVIGRSVEGRAIEAFEYGAPDVLIFGAIHGDEPASETLCRAFMETLADEPIIVVPAANPDGLAANRKNNAHDVDLNRNFAARSWVPEHAPRYFPGEAPLSEPESQALAALVEELRPRVIVAVHQPLSCVNWDGPAEELARKMALATGWPAVASVGYPTPGSFGACYGIDRGIAVITLELPPGPLVRRDACIQALRYALP